MNTRLLLLALAAVLAAPVVTGAQTPPAQPKPQPAPAQPAGTPATPAGAQPAAPPAPAQPAYSYQVENRRDPFVSLLGRGMDPKANRGAGIAGMLINEISVKGIIRSRGQFAAYVQGPDNRTYTIRAGDKLFDGTVKAVLADSVVFSQDVNDPLSVVKQREVIKKVRSTEEGRE